ncbi:MAG: PEGA domain-containing protein, partial [Methanomicrobium sp.]|nr:PEGA domain-containing protein [Methanomicrobium sp.]
MALSALILLLILMPAVDAAVGEAFKIETEPMGAKIWIDGNYRGLSDKDTVFYSFETGDHLVRLELDGYEPYEVVKTVSEGASEIVYHKFKPIQTTGQIGFYSVPTGAEIYLDGRYVGKTPYTMDKVEPGTYTVVIKHRGYEDWTGSVNVEAGKLSEVNADMVLADVPISIKTQPEGFDLYIDGEYVGKTPYTGTISQGKHTFRAEKLGYRTVEETFYVGFEGVVRMYVPETTVLEAMAEVEATITANLKYNPALAKQLLRQAREAYDLKDYDTAINLTQQAMNAAEDVDLDGVKNADDIVAGIENSKIYVLPFIIAFVLIVLFAANFMRHRVKPVIVLEVPKALRAEGESPQYVKLSVDAKGGAYRAFVCTVYLDDESMEHFVEPGSYEVLIAGTHRTLGDHRVAVELKISKTRYGVTTARSEETYTVFDDENIIDSDSMSLIEGEGADGTGIGAGGKSKPKRFDLGALFSGTSGASGTKGK